MFGVTIFCGFSPLISPPTHWIVYVAQAGLELVNSVHLLPQPNKQRRLKTRLVGRWFFISILPIKSLQMCPLHFTYNITEI